MIGAVYNPLNGRLTARSGKASFSYEVAKTEEGSNHWCSTENNRNNARNVNFADGHASNITNKYYGNVVRPVAAFTFVP
jgi:prepilin-type processing-associated H-X9-DG protein